MCENTSLGGMCHQDEQQISVPTVFQWRKGCIFVFRFRDKRWPEGICYNPKSLNLDFAEVFEVIFCCICPCWWPIFTHWPDSKWVDFRMIYIRRESRNTIMPIIWVFKKIQLWMRVYVCLVHASHYIVNMPDITRNVSLKRFLFILNLIDECTLFNI